MPLLYSVAEIRKIEQDAQSRLAQGTLMQRAGQAAARFAQELLAPQVPHTILVFAGPGNNGGDALEAACQLARAGMDITVMLYGEESRLPADARQALLRAQASPARFVGPAQLADLASRQWSLVIDGLFGIGLSRPITGAVRAAIEFVHTLSCPILALDVPSGLNADTGNIIGPDGIAVRASHTLTFIADKPGLHTSDGRDYAGKVQVADLNIEPDLMPDARLCLNNPALFSDVLQRRPQNSHKGSFGDVIVIGGAQGMQGAPILTGRAALHAGAGRVLIAFIDEALAYDALHPELMLRQASEMNFSTGTLVAGPGAGTSDKTASLLQQVLDSEQAAVLDADALNQLATDSHLQQKLVQRQAATLLTPHPLEAARLLSCSAKEIQSDRIGAAQELADKFGAIVVLKGSGTIIAHPDHSTVINTTGNPALATAGTGDVLAGVCGALLAQQLPAWQAALAAVWLHGQAADQLVAQGLGPIGLTAGEFIPAIRAELNRLVSRKAGS